MDKDSSPQAWDRLFDPENDVHDSQPGPLPESLAVTPEGPVRTSAVVASAWADLVIVGAMTTAILGGVALFGYPLALQALPWALAVALVWWVTTTVILIRVRRATPGMLIAGLVFGEPVSGSRIVAVVAAAAISAALLGIPLVLGGSSRSLLATAAGSALTVLPSVA